MANIREQLDIERVLLCEKVEQALCEFLETTGIAVEEFKIMYHYTDSRLDTDMVQVTTVLQRI